MLKMLIFISGLGDYLMVDLGSTCVKVSDIQLRKHGVKIPSVSYPLDPAMKKATGEEIFDLIVSAISRFVRVQQKSDKQLKSVLVVHFPCHHKTIDKANIAKWTKEFSCEGVVDQDLNELLQKSIRRKTDLKLKVVAIVNSAVNTLISAVCHNPRCMISLVVGNGFNACYVDKHQKEETGGAEGKGSLEIYNTELGALGENGSLDFLRTAYDTELDNTSKKPGSQILEKMASWTYIGEIVRLALKDLRKDQLVLTDASENTNLFKEGVFTANHVATIDKDMSKNSVETADILITLGVMNPTDEDLKTVKYICRLVTERAASLAAASLATLINRLNQPEIVIVVDGELYRQIPRFHDVMYSKTQELVKPALRDKFYLVSSFSGGCIGAVRMAAAALSKQNAAAADT
ncbi:hexokinase type 2-like [Littorina saxatilis]|uniref:hexokinase type 2-like n=1 Tax=Littorina saxatilis TaxID=31220 RepID=UPI0038B54CCC